MDERFEVARTSKPFDLFAEFGRFGSERKMSLQDPATLLAFTGHVGDRVGGALGDSALLHGQRTEAMFESLLVSLGQFELLKSEDAGRLFPDGRYQSPDFRTVLKDGSHWLIEVKNVYEGDPARQKRRLLTKSQLERLTAYAGATGAELKLAIFWARWSIWTLVSPDRLVGADGGLVLDIGTAMRVNELSRLGDRSFGVRPPLRLRVTMDQARTSPVGADGRVTCTIGGVKVFSGDQEIVWVFMQYGEWQSEEPDAILDGDRLLAIEFRWVPRERVNQGFEFVGTLSRMFAAYYARQTVDSGEVVQVRAPLRPSWFEPLLSWEKARGRMSLWSFTQEPNFETPAGK